MDMLAFHERIVKNIANVGCMHEHKERHELFLRKAILAFGVEDAVYITENTYDGGYEIRVGSCDFFVDYETVEEEDTEYIKKQLSLCI